MVGLGEQEQGFSGMEVVEQRVGRCRWQERETEGH